VATKNIVRTSSGAVRRVIVVGGGLGGLMTVIKLCEANVPVLLFSLVPVKRSHSVCAQGGINASVNTKGEGDSPQVHLEETAYGGDFLANQPPIKGMCDAAPGIVYMLDRMGVPFNRTPEGLLDFRRFGGTLFSISGASVARCFTAPLSPVPPPGSSCSTRSTSRSAATRPSRSKTSTA